MARELKGLAAGLAAGLGVVALAFGVSAIVTHGQPPPEPKPVQQALSPGMVSSNVVSTGRALYVVSCAGCHGSQGQGKNGPPLRALGDPDTKIARNIKHGFPPRMPAFQNQYNDTQTNALVAYIQTLK